MVLKYLCSTIPSNNVKPLSIFYSFAFIVFVAHIYSQRNLSFQVTSFESNYLYVMTGSANQLNLIIDISHNKLCSVLSPCSRFNLYYLLSIDFFTSIAYMALFRLSDNQH